jgi:regulator of protease activity HflC (stomatin/prohibitin superfamily)
MVRIEMRLSFPLIPFTLFLTISHYVRTSIIRTEINASRRLKEAAAHKAEADKVRQVKGAEAEAEARYLSGLGVARQRKAIVSGLQASVSEFSDAVEGTRPSDVMNILLLSQYMDTLSVVGANSLILEHDPATVTMLQSQVSKSFSKSKK